MMHTVKNISFHEGLPDEKEFSPYKKEHTVCVIDDLLADAKDNKLLIYYIRYFVFNLDLITVSHP